MTDHEFRALMSLVMSADPSPVSPDVDAVVTGLLDREAVERGFDGWVTAYHEFSPSDEIDRPNALPVPPGTLTHTCGLPMSLNGHPNAGEPLHVVEVGATHECVPCLIKARNRNNRAAAMLADLDRCRHGRHRGDVCSGCHGQSVGNPFAQGNLAYLVEDHEGAPYPHGTIGIDINGRPIVANDRDHRKWGPVNPA